MSDEVYKVFFISEGLNENLRVKQIYSAKDYTTAECYFKAYISEVKNKSQWNCWQLGKFIKNQFKQEKIYICNGCGIIPEKSIKTLKAEYDKAMYAKKNEQIKLLFGGKKIEE